MIKDISIVITSKDHPVNPIIKEWININKTEFNINFVRTPEELKEGDILFLISCSDIINPEILNKFRKSLVIHASDLPKGRGYSPHIWAILNGEDTVFISLIEASEKFDRGNIWKKLERIIPKSYIYEDILGVINSAHCELMDFALANFYNVSPKEQSTVIEPSYHAKRTPELSQLDINKSIREQFDLLRVCDKKRFPAFFWIHGKKFKVVIESYDE
jgi:methionyl-tRNA formyltransferase